MNPLAKYFKIAIRWIWLGTLIFVAFHYLTSGLSQNSNTQRRNLGSLITDRLGQTPLKSWGQNPWGKVGQKTGSHHIVSKHPHVSLQRSIAMLDEAHAEHVQSAGLQSANNADWLTICRRLSLSLVGSGLSLEEIRNLEQKTEEKRVEVHLQNLLDDSRHHHYWAERWARYLVGTDGGQFIVYRRRRFRIWLAEVLAENRPYDQIVKDLITAEGLWTDRPEVNFYTATFDSNDGNADPVRLAARTARVFLGLRIDCLQCHDDFLGNVNLGQHDDLREGKQQDFHQLAAFFTGAKTNGLQGLKSGKSDYEYQYLDSEASVTVQPKVPYDSSLFEESSDPRMNLANWITHPQNDQAARSAVSHVWAILFGRPIGQSVDNLPLDENVHPLLNPLARDFVEHGFDLRRLIKVITSLKVFRVDSRADFPITEEHEDLGAVFPLVQLRPEQVAGAIIQASRIKKTDRDSSLLLQLQEVTSTNEFVQRFGDRGEEEFESDHVTITQRLLMMNGNMVRESVESNPVLNTTAHLNMFAENDAMVINSLYLCVLNRLPSQTEHKHFTERMTKSEDRSEAIVDLMWVLTNSSELTWNH